MESLLSRGPDVFDVVYNLDLSHLYLNVAPITFKHLSGKKLTYTCLSILNTSKANYYSIVII